MAKSKTISSPRAGKARNPAAKAKPRSAPKAGAASASASRLIDQRIRDLGGWRAATLARMRALILEAVPGITEEVKWRGTPVWSHNGIVCTGEAYAQVVKLTFARGASVPDSTGLFNASLEGGMRRAIDVREGEKVDARAFKALVKAAAAVNAAAVKKASRGAREAKPGRATKPGKTAKTGKVVLLSGGNPQIAKADGDAPVQAYIAAMPGWKSDLGRRLDALIERAVPGVRKAVRWNSPFYAVEGRGWFLSFHVFARYVKVTFFDGAFLRPIPPGGTPKSKDARWIDIYEDDILDDALMAVWVKQAAELPGWEL